MPLYEHVFLARQDISNQQVEAMVEQFKTVISIDKAAWEKELQLHAELFQQLEYHLPRELGETKAQIEKRLAA